MKLFSEVCTRDDLANCMHIHPSKLKKILYRDGVDQYYSSFEIPKRSGGTRLIHAPSDDLKDLQKGLANSLYNFRDFLISEGKISAKASHGFERTKNIISNAGVHRNKRYVLNVDLLDFFSSFNFGRVMGYFEKNRNFLLPHEVAVTIAQIACYKGVLPQGSPCSPVIANFIFSAVDLRIIKLAKRYRLTYSRYADDLSFSTNNKEFADQAEEFLSELKRILLKSGFSMNEEKTRLQYAESRQAVTGLTVNHKVNVNRIFFRNTKAMAHHLYKSGEFTINGELASIEQLEGRFSFIQQLDEYNNTRDKKRHDSHTLCGREKQYQAFLYYKFFFANEKPLIITEGKTDIRYLTAALQHYCQLYPELIETEEDGSYNLKIAFLKRSKRWTYFFNLSMDGADSIKNLFYYAMPGKQVTNYLSAFSELSGQKQANPIMFLFDHECSGKDKKKPLLKFLNEFNISKDDRAFLDDKLFLKLPDKGKYFLLTNPLMENMEECEIEDLFSKSILEQQIDGKTFSRDSDYDRALCFGKDEFSKIVLSNYQTIDFSNFVPILNNIREIVVSQQEGRP